MTRQLKRGTNFLLSSVLLLFIATLTQCSKDDPAPATRITGIITNISTAAVLEGVNIIVFDASTNSPVYTTTSDASGYYTLDVVEGTYFQKFYKQGYISVPPPGVEAIPFTVAKGETVDQPAQMTQSSVVDAGYISGKISVANTPKAGVLVVAESNGAAYSGVSNDLGVYTIYNVPAGSYAIKAFLVNHSSTTAQTNVSANSPTSNVDLQLTEGVTGSVEGSFKVISQTTILTPPAEMDISLVHPITRETIPGLSKNGTYSSSITFMFSQVPDGTYIVRATYKNDYIVIDPDYIAKFGDYKVTVINGGMASVDIVATSAVLLTSPTNEMTKTVPVASTGTPTFKWESYPSTSDYVIEVTDATTGNVIWGGFSNTPNGLVKNIVIPSNTTSIAFNADGKATTSLQVGRIYRWRIFASKNNNATNSWDLIAASEDQMGLIKIQ